MDFMTSPSISENDVKIYHLIGESLLEDLLENQSQKELTISLSDFLAKLARSSQIATGRSMEIIWILYGLHSLGEPSTPASEFEIENLLARLDALKWTSVSSVHELVALRKSMAHILDTLNLSDRDLREMIEVCLFRPILASNADHVRIHDKLWLSLNQHKARDYLRLLCRFFMPLLMDCTNTLKLQRPMVLPIHFCWILSYHCCHPNGPGL